VHIDPLGQGSIGSNGNSTAKSLSSIHSQGSAAALQDVESESSSYQSAVQQCTAERRIMSDADFLQAMAAPAVEKPAAEAPRVNKVSVTEDDVLASLEQMKKDAPQTAPKEGSMAAMAADAPPTPSAMNKAPSSDPFEGL
jgi:type IV secretory pathway VirJ component